MADDALTNFYKLVEKMYELYPEAAEFSSKPGIGDMLLRAVNEGWSASRVTAALHRTPYWQSTTRAERQWDVLYITDRAEANRRLSAGRAVVREAARNLGLQMTKQQLAYTTQYAVTHGFSPKEITYHMLAQRRIGDFTPGNSNKIAGEVGATMAKVASRAEAFGISLSNQSLFNHARNILQGDETEGAMDQYLRNQALSKYQAKDVQRALKDGMTIKDYMDPYLQVAAQTLELNPAALNLGDAKWMRAIDTVAQDGTRQVLSLADWQRTIKTDADYGYDQTNGAISEAAKLTTQLAQTFGATA
jgi:hypothetical protein